MLKSTRSLPRCGPSVCDAAAGPAHGPASQFPAPQLQPPVDAGHNTHTSTSLTFARNLTRLQTSTPQTDAHRPPGLAGGRAGRAADQTAVPDLLRSEPPIEYTATAHTAPSRTTRTAPSPSAIPAPSPSVFPLPSCLSLCFFIPMLQDSHPAQRGALHSLSAR